MEIEKRLQDVCREFRIEGKFLRAEQIKDSNVNKTYRVTFLAPDRHEKSYIVRKVNAYAFRKPEQLIDNVDLITEHIRAKKKGQMALAKDIYSKLEQIQHIIDGCV